MAKPVKIRKAKARRLALKCQGLSGRMPFGSGSKAVVRLANQIGYVQIDTISVIERSHHHTFWTRIENYNADMLIQHTADVRDLFEYWAHAAAYLPVQNYRFCLPRMHAFRNGEKHWFERDLRLMNYVYDRIKAEGPLQARDFKDTRQKKTGPWYEWKPAKRALEQLFIEGRLMVARRNNFQKVYDLAERVLPDDVNKEMPCPAEMAIFLINSAVAANGVVSEDEICYLRKGIKKDIRIQIKHLLEDKKLIEVDVEGITHKRYVTFAEFLTRKLPAPTRSRVHLLSPFDNLIIQRKRVQELFDFKYQLECYLPASKRKHGYFSLPVLWGDQFVGSLDPKADRKRSVLLINNVSIDPQIICEPVFCAALASRIAQLAVFNGCESIKFMQNYENTFEHVQREANAEIGERSCLTG